MPWYDFIWDYSPDGNIDHLAEHDVTRDEAEEILQNPSRRERSRSNGKRWIAFGETRSGRELVVVYEVVDSVTLQAITAFEI